MCKSITRVRLKYYVRSNFDKINDHVPYLLLFLINATEKKKPATDVVEIKLTSLLIAIRMADSNDFFRVLGRLKNSIQT